MTAVTICSDFEAQENKVCHCFHCSPSICHAMKWWDQMPWSSFFECWVLNQLFLNITFVKKHPFFWVNQYFTKFAVNYSIVCIDHIIHSTIQGHLDCFQLLTINKQQWISPYLTYGDHLCALLLGIYRIENAVF